MCTPVPGEQWESSALLKTIQPGERGKRIDKNDNPYFINLRKTFPLSLQKNVSRMNFKSWMSKTKTNIQNRTQNLASQGRYKIKGL